MQVQYDHLEKYFQYFESKDKLKTAYDVMLTKNKIPFVNENEIMINALKILNKKKLGFLVIVNNEGLNTGVFTDGDLKRIMQRKKFINNLKIKQFMTKKPFCVEKINDDEVTKYFNDNVYKGIVTKYISSLKINN